MKEKIRRILPYIIAAIGLYLFLIVMVSLFFLDRYEREKKLYLQKRLETASVEIETLKLTYDTIARTMFDSSINTPCVTEMMARAADGDDEQKERIRHQLYGHFSRLYRSLEEHNVRQLHFHLPGSVSFLRFHRPEKYGDSLQGIRPAIDAVNRTRRSVSGFEEGRIFNGFRHVFPLFHEGRFVGTVELSYSFDAIKRLAQNLYPAYYTLILRRSVVENKVFSDERSNYSTSALSPDYLVDNRLHERGRYLFTKERLSRLNAVFSESFEDFEDQRTPRIIPAVLDGKGYLMLLNPLESFDRKHVGYIVAYLPDQHLINLESNFKTVIMFALILGVPPTVMIVYFLYRLRQHHKLLIRHANTDRLTRIANRASLLYQIGFMIKNARRGRTPLSVIFFDIDHFKQINDAHGHRMGDKALVDVSTLVKKRIRESDIVGRWGGEEFIILLPHTKLHDAIMLAEEIRILIGAYPFEHGCMSCSFGVAELEEDDTHESLINRADAMLYEAKAQGRNRVCPGPE